MAYLSNYFIFIFKIHKIEKLIIISYLEVLFISITFILIFDKGKTPKILIHFKTSVSFQ